jgi:hypothetical protein
MVPLVVETLSQFPPETVEVAMVKFAGRGIPLMIRKVLEGGFPPTLHRLKCESDLAYPATPRLATGRSTAGPSHSLNAHDNRIGTRGQIARHREIDLVERQKTPNVLVSAAEDDFRRFAADGRGHQVCRGRPEKEEITPVSGGRSGGSQSDHEDR